MEEKDFSNRPLPVANTGETDVRTASSGTDIFMLSLVVSLFVHVFFILLFLKLCFFKSSKTFCVTTSIQNGSMPAQLRARRSSFGWVFFDNSNFSESILSSEIRESKDKELKKNLNEKEENSKKQECFLSGERKELVDENNKPKKNIIALMKGFIDNIIENGEQEGEDLISRPGDPRKRPDLEDLKYQVYQTEIIHGLQAAWKQNFLYKKTIPENYIRKVAFIAFDIDSEGKAQDIKVINSSGIMELDELFIKVIKSSSPFPPIPKHFGKSRFPAGGPFQIVSDRFLGF